MAGPLIEVLNPGDNADPQLVNGNFARIKAFLSNIPIARLAKRQGVHILKFGFPTLDPTATHSGITPVVGHSGGSTYLERYGSAFRAYPGDASSADAVRIISLQAYLVLESIGVTGKLGIGDVVVRIEQGSSMDPATATWATVPGAVLSAAFDLSTVGFPVFDGADGKLGLWIRTSVGSSVDAGKPLRAVVLAKDTGVTNAAFCICHAEVNVEAIVNLQ